MSNKIRKKIREETAGSEDDEVCGCRPTDSEPCGIGANCVNRSLLIECGVSQQDFKKNFQNQNQERCMSGEKCHNKSFERGSNDDDFEIFDLKWGGKGLKTLKEIKKGQFIIEYVGEVISAAESKAGL